MLPAQQPLLIFIFFLLFFAGFTLLGMYLPFFPHFLLIKRQLTGQFWTGSAAQFLSQYKCCAHNFFSVCKLSSLHLSASQPAACSCGQAAYAQYLLVVQHFFGTWLDSLLAGWPTQLAELWQCCAVIYDLFNSTLTPTHSHTHTLKHTHRHTHRAIQHR